MKDEVATTDEDKPDLPINCPWCGEALRFVCTAEDAEAQWWSVPVYECRAHGTLYLTRDGFNREPPQLSQSVSNTVSAHYQHATINVPEWDGVARVVSEVWRLRKGTHRAICSLLTHPIGAEARLVINGELERSHAGRSALIVVELALDWKERFQEKGWQ